MYGIKNIYVKKKISSLCHYVYVILCVDDISIAACGIANQRTNTDTHTHQFIHTIFYTVVLLLCSNVMAVFIRCMISLDIYVVVLTVDSIQRGYMIDTVQSSYTYTHTLKHKRPIQCQSYAITFDNLILETEHSRIL